MGNNNSNHGQIESFSRVRGINKNKINKMSRKLQECTKENQHLQKKMKDAAVSIYNLHMNLEACKAQCSDFSPKPYPLPY
jgi:predicted  nucleic acid-binding Zn-ribbon protein